MSEKDKLRVFVSVTGRANTGKTTIMKKIKTALEMSNIEVSPVWGIEGPPRQLTSEFDLKTTKKVAEKVRVTLTEFQCGRVISRDTPEDVKVGISYVAGIGYEAYVSLLGISMKHNFGDLEWSKEKALALATRLAVELEVEVEDKTVRALNWVQPQ